MTNEHRSNLTTAPRGEPSTFVKVAVCAAVIGVMGCGRLGIFHGRVMPIAFGMPLVVFVWLKDRRLLWITVGIFAAVTIFKYAFLLPIQDSEGKPLDPAERVIDASLVMVDLLVIAAVVHGLIGAHAALRRSNRELSQANLDLATREEEIVRQN